ncbi:MAG TPA: bifunctional alpha,alpha-trehalose-phosphate synthase (UDP-forming)/trehalose-phosphatase [Chloroflexia bacterium]|nr:bifunctional alpha,alpha-trehalose-phosphate synthase (UDP-forming)/trehalose-phosphatase [Chloroflexia bacterium]
MANGNSGAHRLLIVANRSPFTVVEEDGELQFKVSSGGLVSGLSAYLDKLSAQMGTKADYLWVGWPGSKVSDKNRDKLKEVAASKFNSHPVFLSEEEMEKFYHGFCNKTVWPLFHYFPVYTTYGNEYWEVYKKVNQVFCDAVMEVIQPGDVVWVHDYHLMLLPRMLRERMPDAKIGFFLHIPFPSFEIYRLLPKKWCMGILEGLLGADLVGFHTFDYTQYFLRSVGRVLGHEHNLGQIFVGDRIVKADTFPMGIDFDKFNHALTTPEVEAERAELKTTLADEKVVLSIDRLDYSKGIPNRLEGFELFLKRNPQWHKKVVLALVVIPSRIGVEHYQAFKDRIEKLVGSINGKFGTLDWTPIRYQYRTVPFASLVALYSTGDIALVTPLRDGMNLIAKEYVASRADNTGVLILSEMAGAAKELGEALIINPNSREEIADAIEEALALPKVEQARRNFVMQKRLRRYDVVSWAKDFISQLDATQEAQARYKARLLSRSAQEQLERQYREAERRLIFLDYDGTLMPFANDPSTVIPTTRVRDILVALSEDPRNEVVLVSGRDRDTLQEWFGGLRMGLVAEHGVWLKPRYEQWRMIRHLTNEWKARLRPVLEMYVDRLPGSFIEEKDFSLVWHYRAADPELAPVRAMELSHYLASITRSKDVQVLQGHKVIEVKNSGVNKGTAALHWMSHGEYSFILTIGDDWTDEHLFESLPAGAYSIRVGMTQSAARFNLRDTAQVLQFLEQLAFRAESLVTQTA